MSGQDADYNASFIGEKTLSFSWYCSFSNTIFLVPKEASGSQLFLLDKRSIRLF